MNDSVAEVFEKYVGRITAEIFSGSPIVESDSRYAALASLEAEVFAEESKRPCSKCGSDNVDRSRGYRGEYFCNDCRHSSQLGGKDAKS